MVEVPYCVWVCLLSSDAEEDASARRCEKQSVTDLETISGKMVDMNVFAPFGIPLDLLF